MNQLRIERHANNEVLHGGARRRPITIVAPQSQGTFPISCQWYTVEPGARVTLHRHTTKSELWCIVAGTGVVTLGDDKTDVQEGAVILIPPFTAHALENVGEQPLIFVSVAHPPTRFDPSSGTSVGTEELE